MKRKAALILLLGLISFANLYGQKFEIAAEQKTLSEVLIELRKKYDFQFSFDNQLLSGYTVNANRNFSSKEDLLAYLLKNLPLGYKQVNGVFLIFPQEKIRHYLLTGRVMDLTSLEPLPFSHLTINDAPMISDENGNFSFESTQDSLFRILASHLGFFVMDTTVQEGQQHQLLLQPASTDLPEIKVTDQLIQKFIKMGNEPGRLQLNHRIAGYLPTNTDNSVFNLLRLQPGILAAGEQTKDIVIWGSYEGESQVLFDGITIWGLKNFNEDIGAVNPLVVKNIEVLKGGYDARYGDRVGGIVYISGKNGNRVKPELNLSLNNITASGSWEQPLGKNSSLLFAFRHTYYNLYEDEDLSLSTSGVKMPKNISDQMNGEGQIGLNVVPDYVFKDFNAKFTTQKENGDLFYVSLMGGKDQFDYKISPEGLNELQQSKQEKNEQLGGALHYGKSWKNGNTSNLTLSSSQLTTSTLNTIQVTRARTGATLLRRDDRSYNKIEEYKAKLMNRIAINQNQELETGLSYIHNRVNLEEDSLSINILQMESVADRASAYLQDRIRLHRKLSARVGLHASYPFDLGKIYWEPRLSLSYRPFDFLSLNAAWGRYHQFITKSSVLDESGNYRFIWAASNNEDVPVLESEHWVGGWSYHRNSFTLSWEAYYKSTQGHTRYFKYRRDDAISQGDSRSYGMDVYTKKDFGNHSIWLAYTLSKTEERFSYFRTQDYRRALHDQRHEIKAAGLLSLRPFYLSANYIYGSGFPLYSAPNDLNYNEPDYNRLDAALIYKFIRPKVRWEVGVLFQNILDAENIKYTSFERIPFNQLNSININTETVPSSVRLYFKITI